MASATGDGGSDDDHMLLRVVGAFCAVVFPDRLETYEGATHVKDEAQMEGRLAITGMGFLDAEYVMTSLAISLDFRAHFAQEERNANFKRLSPEQREACVRALAEAQREGKRPTIVLGTKGPLPGVEAVGDVYLIERSNVHYYTSEREGAPPMTRDALISRATAALKATLLAAAERVGAESEEVRSHLAAMVDECLADAAFDGVRGAAGDELRALQTRIAALGARAATKAASGTLDSFVGGSKRPRDDPGVQGTPSKRPTSDAAAAPSPAERKTSPGFSSAVPPPPTANMMRKNWSLATATKEVQARNAKCKYTRWRMPPDYESTKHIWCTTCKRYLSANKDGVDSHEDGHNKTQEEETIDAHFARLRQGLLKMEPSEARQLMTSLLFAAGVSQHVIGLLKDDADLLELAAAALRTRSTVARDCEVVAGELPAAGGGALHVARTRCAIPASLRPVNLQMT